MRSFNSLVRCGPIRPRGRLLVATALMAGTVPATATAQVTISSRAAEITLTGRVHTQFNTTSAPGALASEFLLRRARFTAVVRINDVVSGRIQPDFGGGTTSLKDAYVEFRFDPMFRLTAGQFKRAFDLFELTSSTQTLVVERAGGVRGVDSCAGPGGVCSLSRFTAKLDYSDRDVGMRIAGSNDRVAYQVAVTNGTGGTGDDNGTKSYSGRISVTAGRDVTISGNASVHDYVNDVTTEDDYAAAYGADLELGNYSRGLHVQAGIVFGANWENLDATGDASTFVATQGIVTYKSILAEGGTLAAVEPLARVSWGDPDTGLDADDGLLFTPGFVLHFVGRNKIAANVDIWTPRTGETEWSIKVQSYLHF